MSIPEHPYLEKKHKLAQVAHVLYLEKRVLFGGDGQDSEPWFQTDPTEESNQVGLPG